MSSLQAIATSIEVQTCNSSLPSMRDCSFLPVFDLDPRPTFVVQETPSPSILFVNKALESLSELTREIKSSLQQAQSYLDLLSHISSNVDNQCPSLHDKPVFTKRSWVTYTIEERWRVFSTDSYVLPRHVVPTVSVFDIKTTNLKRKRIPTKTDVCPAKVKNTTVTSPTQSSLLENLLQSSPYNHQVCTHDWSQTLLGPIEAWPTEHLAALANALNDSAPAMILLGTKFVAMYNESAKPILEARLGPFVGKPAQEANDRWDNQFRGIFEEVARTGKGVTLENIPNGGTNISTELYMTLAISPIFNAKTGGVTGLHLSLRDVTQQMLRDRRQGTLVNLSAEVLHDSIQAVYKHFVKCLNSRDVPQAILYSRDDTTGSAVCRMQDSISWQPNDSINFNEFILNDVQHPLASLFRKSMAEKEPFYMHTEEVPETILSGLVGDRGFEDPCNSVAIMPIRLAANQSNLGFMLLGLGTRQPYDDHYKSYIVALQRTLAASIEAHQHGEAEIELRKRTKVAQEKAELRFTRFSHHTSIGMCIYNPDGSLSFANEVWWRMTGFSHDIDTTAPGWWAPAVQAEDLPIAFEQFSKLLDDKLPVTFEIRYAQMSKYRLPDDSANLPIWMLVSAYAELSDEQELDFVVACFTDITEQKFLVEIERRRTEDAIEAKRQQESFVDITSHEIRNPLSAVLQCSQEISEILYQHTLSEKTHVEIDVKDLKDVVSAAETIEHCTMHQKGLVDDILTLSKMDAGLLPVSCELAEPELVAKKTLAFFARELNQIAIRTSLVIDPSYTNLKIDSLQFDAGRISQILVNLLTNAIKFTKTAAKREIELRIGATQHASVDLWPLNYLPVAPHKIPVAGQEWEDDDCVYLHFAVHDTGLGMSTEDQNNLFQRFSQGNTKTYTQYGGSGLGLFIARALVEIHGGQIGFKSLSGQGSQFGFYVKTRRKIEAVFNQAQSNGSLADVSTVAASTYDILVVEDNLINQKVLRRQLLRHGHRVQIANHGEEALAILKRSRFCIDNGEALSCILMDIEMPVMDGYTCTKIIRNMQVDGEVRNHVPILATTGNARDEKVQLALSAGMDNVVLKPFTMDQMLPLLQRLVESKSLDEKAEDE